MSKYSKSANIYAFIDSQNLNLGTSKDMRRGKKVYYQGWNIDFSKFFVYLRNKYRIQKAFLFIGYIKNNEKLYKYLRECGYELVFKPTVKNIGGKTKGNIDAEIVLYASRLVYDEYDKAIFVSGDGDFYCLYDFLDEVGKLEAIIIPNKFSASSLLKKFERYKRFIYRDKRKLEKKDGRRRSIPHR